MKISIVLKRKYNYNQTMKVAAYQFCPKWGDPIKNRNQIIERLEAIAEEHLDLIVLPELTFSGYLFEKKEEAVAFSQTADSSFFDPIQELCNRKNWGLICGFIEKEDSGDLNGKDSLFFSLPLFETEEQSSQAVVLYNSALFFRPHQKPVVYRKNHLYDREKLFFTQGNSGYPIFEFKGTQIGILICFDHLFPEAARILALKGATVICHCANLVLPGYAQITSCARALENRIYWILANRFGTEYFASCRKKSELLHKKDLLLTDSADDYSLTYSGKSRIVSPYGEVLAEATADEEELLVVQIEPSLCHDKRLGLRNHLFLDRREVDDLPSISK